MITREKWVFDRLTEKYFGMMKAVAESGEDLQNNYTPPEICDMLLEKIDLTGNKSVLVLYNIEIIFQLWKRGYSGKITFFTSSEKKREFALKLFDGINIEKINEGENPLERLEEMEKWPEKFDIIVSNPPYSKKLDLKFLDKCVDLAEEQVVFVHPSSQYVDGKKIYKPNIRNLEKIKPHLKEVDFFNGNPIFGINLFVPCVITHLDKKNNNKEFKLTNKINGQDILLDKEEISNLSLFGYNEKLISFKNKILNNIKIEGSLNDIGNILGSMTKDLRKLKKEGDFFVEFTRIRGNINLDNKNNTMLKEDFFTFFKKDVKIEKGRNPEYDIWFEFSTEAEAKNFISYLKTDFARMCLAGVKTAQALYAGELKFVPAVDFTQEWTDEKLYAHFNITEEEQAFIKEIIPPYYDL